MTARILDGKAVAGQIRIEVADRVRALAERGVTPGLAAVLVGDDQASRIYVGSKHKACADVGIRSEQIDMPPYVTAGELHAQMSPSMATASTGARVSRTASPNGSLPRLPTVHSPKENLSSGRGV